MSIVNQRSENIVWHESVITQNDREELLNQKGAILWFTGLSGSGKSTFANEVAAILHKQGYLTYVLDGDNIRQGLNKNLGFSPEDRTENIRRIGEVAKLFADCGVLVLTAFISPYQQDRDLARSLLPSDRFVEIYCNCDLEICEARDSKGLYKKARAGEIKDFTGIDAPYEIPKNPEIIIETNTPYLETNLELILDYLSKKRLIVN